MNLSFFNIFDALNFLKLTKFSRILQWRKRIASFTLSANFLKIKESTFPLSASFLTDRSSTFPPYVCLSRYTSLKSDEPVTEVCCYTHRSLTQTSVDVTYRWSKFDLNFSRCDGPVTEVCCYTDWSLLLHSSNHGATRVTFYVMRKLFDFQSINFSAKCKLFAGNFCKTCIGLYLW